MYLRKHGDSSTQREIERVILDELKQRFCAEDWMENITLPSKPPDQYTMVGRFLFAGKLYSSLMIYKLSKIQLFVQVYTWELCTNIKILFRFPIFRCID